MVKDELLSRMEKDRVHFLRLQFTDLMGTVKNVEVPQSQFEKAVSGDVMFDGSSIEGFSRIEESDMLLVPDLDTYTLYPWPENGGRGCVARLICDVSNPDGSPFEGCPRRRLEAVVAKAAGMGFTMMAGPEAEFFLFQKDAQGNATTRTQDSAGYFDLTPVDKGEDARRDIVNALEFMGFEVEAAHHEVAPGQHEVDFRYTEAVRCADNVSTFKFVVRRVADLHGLHATFMPKPIHGICGSGMHVHQSLFRGEENAFFDAKDESGLSAVARGYIAGLLDHARGMAAVTNPLVNSYKRLVPGYEAPTNIAWSGRNRSPLVRIPARRGCGTRCEFRMPDPACNPYLALAAMLAAGLDGIERKAVPPPPVNRNIYEMTPAERRRHRIRELPYDLNEAIDAFLKDEVIRAALGAHIVDRYAEAKRAEWREYIARVHPWEVERYLSYT
jgi:glutamine synthetase